MLYIDDEINSFNLEEALMDISHQRREQALKFRHEQGQRLCVAAYLLLKQGLALEYGICDNPELSCYEGGKPFIVGHPEIHFNFSHCREAAVCVVSDRRVGVDVESISRYKESLARYTMNCAEMEYIVGSRYPDIEFTRLWTMKEAKLKLTGEGIRNDLKSVLTGDEQFRQIINVAKGYVVSYITDVIK